MPFHVRCSNCKNMIAKGVRFNAVKQKGYFFNSAGRYLGTYIFKFTMPCPNCKNTMIIKTDPESAEYLLVLGCVKYVVDYDGSQIGVEKIQTQDEAVMLNKYPQLKLENKRRDIKKGEEQKPVIQNLLEKKVKYIYLGNIKK